MVPIIILGAGPVRSTGPASTILRLFGSPSYQDTGVFLLCNGLDHRFIFLEEGEVPMDLPKEENKKAILLEG